ncbi:response regulator transcription factor [Chloroflexus sp.]|uniref:response regulator transcription factor n=1 Tax=Chloroflexus sp. TaxID=1904827 RepID=UPI002616A307|nr:response regulator transcription factor [uncultured Chloroflexus sp.]
MSVPRGILIGGLGEFADEYLVPLFQAAGYYISVARGWTQLLDTFSRQIDLALLDLPGEHAIDRLREARNQFTGVLMILGPRNDRLIVTAFAEGVEDYVPRPFRADELMARARAQLRRQQRHLPPPFTLGLFTFDLAERSITYAGRRLDLDLPAYTLLCVLAEAPYRTFTAEELVALVWGRNQAHNLLLIDALLQSLRRQIGDQYAHEALVGDLQCGISLLPTTAHNAPNTREQSG